MHAPLQKVFCHKIWITLVLPEILRAAVQLWNIIERNLSNQAKKQVIQHIVAYASNKLYAICTLCTIEHLRTVVYVLIPMR